MMTRLFVIVSGVLASFGTANPVFSAEDVHSSGSHEMHQAMQNKMKQMENLAMTGNPDEDFVRMMIPHHQGAIDAARAELKNGKDPEIKKMAQKSIREQEKEISKMKAWLEKNTKKST